MAKVEEGWLTVALLCAMVVVAGAGVAAAGWTEGLHAAWLAGVIGIGAGLALARSRFPGPLAFLFLLIYGIFIVGVLMGLDLNGTWHERGVELLTRLNAFAYKALHGGTSRDPLPFPVAIALLFWFVGALSAWSVFRRGAIWPAVIPGGIGLLVNAYYYFGPARLDLYLAVYVLLALMFVARMSLLDREREWQSARVLYSTDLRLDFLRAGLAAALIGVMVAWAAPSLAASPQAAGTWRRVSGSFGFVRESWMRMFAAIRGYGQAYNDFYGDTLVLGGPARLSNEPIMQVQVVSMVRLEGEDPEAVLQSIQRYYWRANTFGAYRDGGWLPTELDFKEFDPERTRLAQTLYLQRRKVTLAFNMHLPATNRMYVAQQVEWVDRPASLELIFAREGSREVSSVRAAQAVRRGETYQIVSSVSVAGAASLRQAGTEYPEWVQDSYLALPPEITERTRALAQQIVQAAGATTPYDQAEAITNWLRANIRYDQEIDAPPAGVEPVDFFLFESKRGYCNYYATAEIVLLRSLGIPARLAVGMAQGKADQRSGTYHVVEADAHAWPEVFFPSYGWIEFEPTVSQDAIVRPEGSADGATTGEQQDTTTTGLGANPDKDRLLPGEEFEDPAAPRSDIRRSLLERLPWAQIAGVAGGLVALALASTWLTFRSGLVGWENMGRMGGWVLHRRGRLLPSAVGLVYLHLERVANWLGIGAGQAVTPNERAEALGSYLPGVRPGVETITSEYVAEQYSPRAADAGKAQTAWRGIRLQVWHDAVREWLLAVLEEEPVDARHDQLMS